MLLAPLCNHKAGGFPLPCPASKRRDVLEPALARQPWLVAQQPQLLRDQCLCTAQGDRDWGGGTRSSGRVSVPGAQRSQAWESTVHRWLGTPSITLGGPCMCTRALSRGCLSPHPGRGGGWGGASRAPSLPRAAMAGGSLGEGLGGGRGHGSLGCHPSPNPCQLLAGRAAEVARSGWVALVMRLGGGMLSIAPSTAGRFCSAR